MKVKPVRQVAMIKPDKVEDKSAGGLFIPDTARDRLQVAVDRGELIAHGDGFFEDLPGPIPKVGDKVLFDRYAGSLITIQGDDGIRQNYRLCNDDKIIAIMEGGVKK
jgi:chaperonin GroES